MTKRRLLWFVSLTISLTWPFSARPQTKTIPATVTGEEEKTVDAKGASSTSTKANFIRNNEDSPSNRAAREIARKLYKQGVKYGRSNLTQQAAQSFQEALKQYPDYRDALYGLGRASLDLGRFKEAIGAFEKLLKLDPNSADAYTGLGEAYAKFNQTKNVTQTQDDSAVAERVTLVAKPAVERTEKSNTLPSGNDDLTTVYKVGIGDVLDIRMAGTNTLESTFFTLSSTGMLEYPILGQPINALGLTTKEISERIGAELKRRAIGRESDPQVGVRDYNSHTILVSGLVRESGTKILRREAIPLYVVLADAQPLPEAAQVTIISRRDAKTSIIDLSQAEETSILVLPGDVVSVSKAEKQFFYVGGEVKSPGELPFHKGLTLTQAILSAGGVTTRGEKVQLSRDSGNGLLTLREFKLKEINKGKVPDTRIEPGDRIMVVH